MTDVPMVLEHTTSQLAKRYESIAQEVVLSLAPGGMPIMMLRQKEDLFAEITIGISLEVLTAALPASYAARELAQGNYIGCAVAATYYLTTRLGLYQAFQRSSENL